MENKRSALCERFISMNHSDADDRTKKQFMQAVNEKEDSFFHGKGWQAYHLIWKHISS